jgi:hypothetical protein
MKKFIKKIVFIVSSLLGKIGSVDWKVVGMDNSRMVTLYALYLVDNADWYKASYYRINSG